MTNSIAFENRLDFWIKNNKNVLFKGKHGVGKSAMVQDAFNKHNLKWLYFSASTMDPWVDFIGVPKEKNDNQLPQKFEIIKELMQVDCELAKNWIINNWNLNESDAYAILKHINDKKSSPSYLELVRPKTFATGEVEAIFFDEFNRSPKKVRNAVMELIQFKSVNGLKFPNLKIVWAAINPDDEDDTYDVERLDPAQADRFHISVDIEYKPSLEWFSNRYGTAMAEAAIQWWIELDEKQKDLVSPRRLQYALDVYQEKGNVRDVLPSSSNCSKLLGNLKNGPISTQLAELMSLKNSEKTRFFLQNENNFLSAKNLILKSPTMMNFFVPEFPKEKIASLMAEDEKFFTYILKNQKEIPYYKSICKEILNANTNYNLCKKIKRYNTEKNAHVVDIPLINSIKIDTSNRVVEDSLDYLY